ncbi:MAG: amidohydrolase family protein, partial [Dehalococcoidia bacterium]
IIDAHIHTYQSPEIGLQAKEGDTHTDYCGTIDELLNIMEKSGISKAVMMNMTPVAGMRDLALSQLPEALSEEQRREAETEIDLRMIQRLERRNLWTCEVARENPCLVPFIGLDPIMSPELMRKEILDKVRNQGAKGIKFQGAVQRFYPYDRRLWPAYETAAELGLPVLFHSGGMGPEAQFALPQHFEEVVSRFPQLTVVLAHLGWGFWQQSISLVQSCPNVNFDCCAVIAVTEDEGGLSDKDLLSMIREIGAQRVLFGSDYPWFDPVQGVQRLSRLDLTEEEKRLIFSENAIRIYEI